jgi:hypothetical protein
MHRHMHRRVLVIAIAVMALGLLTTSSALAAKPDVFTVITKNGVDSFYSSDPQCGITGQVTNTFNNVFHVTDRGDLGHVVEANVEGDTIEVGDNGVTYTGHFHLHFTNILAPTSDGPTGAGPAQQTVSIILLGDDGSRVTMTFVDLAAYNAAGDIITEFHKAVCH